MRQQPDEGDEPLAETYENTGPRCPYCRHLARDLEPHHYDEDLSQLECDSCSKTFAVRVYTSTSWTCQPMDQPVRNAP